MSKLYDLRQELADSIIAADIGFTDDNVILRRQTDVWNDLATAIAASRDGMALHIGVAEGQASEEDGLEMELSLTLTIVCRFQTAADATPEEDVWEALVSHVHDLRLSPTDSYAERFRFRSFADVELDSDRGPEWLGRQTVFAKKLSI